MYKASIQIAMTLIILQVRLGKVSSKVVFDVCLHPETGKMEYRLLVRGEHISSAKTTQKELESYWKRMTLFGLQVPSKAEVLNTRLRYNVLKKDALSSMTEKDVQARVQENLRNRKTTVNLASAMIQAKQDLEAALLQGADEDIQADLRERIAKLQQEEAKKKKAWEKKELRMARINQRNELDNVERYDAAQSLVQQQIEAGEINPFMRRPTRPVILWELGKEVQEAQKREEDEEAAMFAAGKARREQREREEEEKARSQKNVTLYDIHNFDIAGEDDLPFVHKTTVKKWKNAALPDGAISLKAYLAKKPL